MESQDNWKNRRAVVRLTLAYCAATVAYCLYKTFSALPPCGDSRVVETVITSAFALAGAVVLGYCGFAAWDDKNKMNANVEVSNVGAANVDPKGP